MYLQNHLPTALLTVWNYIGCKICGIVCNIGCRMCVTLWTETLKGTSGLEIHFGRGSKKGHFREYFPIILHFTLILTLKESDALLEATSWLRLSL